MVVLNELNRFFFLSQLTGKKKRWKCVAASTTRPSSVATGTSTPLARTSLASCAYPSRRLAASRRASWPRCRGSARASCSSSSSVGPTALLTPNPATFLLGDAGTTDSLWVNEKSNPETKLVEVSRLKTRDSWYLWSWSIGLWIRKTVVYVTILNPASLLIRAVDVWVDFKACKRFWCSQIYPMSLQLSLIF